MLFPYGVHACISYEYLVYILLFVYRTLKRKRTHSRKFGIIITYFSGGNNTLVLHTRTQTRIYMWVCVYKEGFTGVYKRENNNHVWELLWVASVILLAKCVL